MSLIGIHISDILYVSDIVKKNKKLHNLALVQIFVTATNNYLDDRYADVLNFIIARKISIVVHASYSINLSRRWTERDWWIHQFVGEIIAAHKLNAFGIVVHVGKKLELSDAEAINNMYTALLYVHNQTKNYTDVKIMLETPSGQGTETLTTIETFCNFMKKFFNHPDRHVKERFGICLDTCHIFAAGVDIRDEKEMNRMFKIIDDSVGINAIKLCHINDSKKQLGSNLDRHESVGVGEIGSKPIAKIVKFLKTLGVPMVLETPAKDIVADYEKIVSM